MLVSILPFMSLPGSVPCHLCLSLFVLVCTCLSLHFSLYAPVCLFLAFMRGNGKSSNVLRSVKIFWPRLPPERKTNFGICWFTVGGNIPLNPGCQTNCGGTKPDGSLHHSDQGEITSLSLWRGGWKSGLHSDQPLAWGKYKYIFSRPGRSQGLLYIHLRNSLINSSTHLLVSHSFEAPPRPNG